jgi:hypothetical protein
MGDESRQPGLGNRFVDALAEALERIEREFILIVAVAHLAREPGYWKPRS